MYIYISPFLLKIILESDDSHMKYNNIIIYRMNIYLKFLIVSLYKRTIIL